MPHKDTDDKRHIILNYFNKDFSDYMLTDDQMAKWDKLIALRDDINAVLEVARAEKKIGKPLEAKVVLECGESVIDDIKAQLDIALEEADKLYNSSVEAALASVLGQLV